MRQSHVVFQLQAAAADMIGLRAAGPSCTSDRTNGVLAFLTPASQNQGFSVVLHGIKTQECPLSSSSRAMTDDKPTPPGSSPQNLGQSDLEFVSRGDTENVHAYDSLDPTYVAKAKVLNDALREIGMGKYQVWSAYHGLRSLYAI